MFTTEFSAAMRSKVRSGFGFTSGLDVVVKKKDSLALYSFLYLELIFQ